jgi:hypothetical protein
MEHKFVECRCLQRRSVVNLVEEIFNVDHPSFVLLLDRIIVLDGLLANEVLL